MTPRLAYLLGLDWLDCDSRNPVVRAVSWGVLGVSVGVVFAGGAVKLVGSEWKRWWL